MNAAVKFLAINDEQTVCDCCGKSNLKRTVVIQLESGEIVRYGTDCAAKTFKAHKAEINSAIPVLTYVQTWMNKTPAHTAEVVAKGVWNKYGFQTKVVENEIYIRNMNQWMKVN